MSTGGDGEYPDMMYDCNIELDSDADIGSQLVHVYAK
jgi:hypothetical protein